MSYFKEKLKNNCGKALIQLGRDSQNNMQGIPRFYFQAIKNKPITVYGIANKAELYTKMLFIHY